MNKLLGISLVAIGIAVFLLGSAILFTAFNKSKIIFYAYPTEIIIALRLVIAFLCLYAGKLLFTKGLYKFIQKNKTSR